MATVTPHTQIIFPEQLDSAHFTASREALLSESSNSRVIESRDKLDNLHLDLRGFHLMITPGERQGLSTKNDFGWCCSELLPAFSGFFEKLPERDAFLTYRQLINLDGVTRGWIESVMPRDISEVHTSGHLMSLGEMNGVWDRVESVGVGLMGPVGFEFDGLRMDLMRTLNGRFSRRTDHSSHFETFNGRLCCLDNFAVAPLPVVAPSSRIVIED